MAMTGRCCFKEDLKQFEVVVSESQGTEGGEFDDEYQLKPLRREPKMILNDSTVGGTEQDRGEYSGGMKTPGERLSLANSSRHTT